MIGNPEAESRREPRPEPVREPLDPRVHLAAERTLLAWNRTGITLMGFGFVVARFGMFLRELATMRGDEATAGHGASVAFGVALILLGVLVNLVAAVEFRGSLARLRAGKPLGEKRLPLAVLLSGILAVVGLALAAYMLLVG